MLNCSVVSINTGSSPEFVLQLSSWMIIWWGWKVTGQKLRVKAAKHQIITLTYPVKEDTYIEKKKGDSRPPVHQRPTSDAKFLWLNSLVGTQINVIMSNDGVTIWNRYRKNSGYSFCPKNKTKGWSFYFVFSILKCFPSSVPGQWVRWRVWHGWVSVHHRKTKGLLDYLEHVSFMSLGGLNLALGLSFALWHMLHAS